MTKLLSLFCLVAALSGVATAAGDATAGKAAYDKACKSCHGADGTPNAAIAKSHESDHGSSWRSCRPGA